MAERYPFSRVEDVEYWPSYRDADWWEIDPDFVYECDEHGDPYTDCIIVAVDGSCRNNGRYGAVAGYGVFFGPGNGWNQSQLLPPEDATSARAELRAAIEGLKAVQDLSLDWGVDYSDAPLSQVIIKSDSEYVVKGVTGNIYEWMDDGRDIADMDLWDELMDLVDDLIYDEGIDVYFWQVPRRFNEDADFLARDVWDY